MSKITRKEAYDTIPLHHLQDLNRVSSGLKSRFLDLVYEDYVRKNYQLSDDLKEALSRQYAEAEGTFYYQTFEDELNDLNVIKQHIQALTNKLNKISEVVGNRSVLYTNLVDEIKSILGGD